MVPIMVPIPHMYPRRAVGCLLSLDSARRIQLQCAIPISVSIWQVQQCTEKHVGHNQGPRDDQGFLVPLRMRPTTEALRTTDAGPVCGPVCGPVLDSVCSVLGIPATCKTTTVSPSCIDNTFLCAQNNAVKIGLTRLGLLEVERATDERDFGKRHLSVVAIRVVGDGDDADGDAIHAGWRLEPVGRRAPEAWPFRSGTRCQDW